MTRQLHLTDRELMCPGVTTQPWNAAAGVAAAARDDTGPPIRSLAVHLPAVPQAGRGSCT